MGRALLAITSNGFSRGCCEDANSISGRILQRNFRGFDVSQGWVFKKKKRTAVLGQPSLKSIRRRLKDRRVVEEQGEHTLLLPRRLLPAPDVVLLS